jgi:hypothetical protein
MRVFRWIKWFGFDGKKKLMDGWNYELLCPTRDRRERGVCDSAFVLLFYLECFWLYNGWEKRKMR